MPWRGADRRGDAFAASGSGAPDPRPGDTVAQIVVVCHANVARSPLAMVMLEAAAQRRLGEAAPVWVRSAGTHARDGLPAAAESRRQARQRGLDLGAHRSALLSRGDVAEADLVLTMTEGQRGRAVKLHPAASGWTFTLPELARLAGALESPTQDPAPRERIRAVVRRCADARPYVARPRHPEDVADPYGGPADGYERMAVALDGYVDRVAAQLFGDRRRRLAAG